MADDVKHPVGEPGDCVASAGRRLGVQASSWLDDWYTSYSPRNNNEHAEGPWAEWVDLAKTILALEAKRIEALQQCPSANEGSER